VSCFKVQCEMKSRWNCGSITCIMCFTCVGSQLSMSSSSANSFSGPLQLCRGIQHVTVVGSGVQEYKECSIRNVSS
uniref:Uncharacterized protein n=1 Tax=Scleropages formosus TaxID=113540 RepID=A0A8C9RIZ4_SCLFO